MKNLKLLVLMLLVGINTPTWAQCDDEIIATYPPPTNTGDQRGNLPPQNKNTQRPDMRNTFNWMVDDPQTALTEADFLGFPFDGLNNAVPNPWAQNFFPFKPSPYDTSVIDFSPQDGWELIYRGFGKGLDN